MYPWICMFKEIKHTKIILLFVCIWFHSCPFALDSQQKSSSQGNANLLPQQSSVIISSLHSGGMLQNSPLLCQHVYWNCHWYNLYFYVAIPRRNCFTASFLVLWLLQSLFSLLQWSLRYRWRSSDKYESLVVGLLIINWLLRYAIKEVVFKINRDYHRLFLFISQMSLRK